MATSQDPHSQKRTNSSFKYANRRERERKLATRAGNQLRLITQEQARDLGFPRTTIQSRIEAGRLHRVIHGVYATHTPPYSREQLWLAAVLAGGPDALLSDWPAAAHYGFAPDNAPLAAQITVASGRARSREGIVVHQRLVHKRDRRWHKGIPVTSPNLTLVHLAPSLPITDLERLLVAAESMGLIDRRRLAELVDERAGRPGIASLAALLTEQPALSRSELERLMLPVIRMAEVPRPLFLHNISVPGRDQPLEVDLYWPDLRLVVELDSQRWHGDWERAEDDRERDQLLALTDRLSHRFVRRRVVEHPEETAERLRALVARRVADMRAMRGSGSDRSAA
jgi:hypothetical protein